jgi:pimeloyl-ACP methyl ester carboxylesterase/class 3 adenylate cyclase/DNA-binding CsgD family transcriptional regulator
MLLETKYAKSDGISIAYQVVEPTERESELDLVFVMGWVSHLDYFWEEPHFARFLRRLTSFSRLILFDKRGTGLSDRVALSELPSLEQRMDDVRAVMDAAGSRRAAVLGISEGAPLCALFAATHPERTRALIMIGGFARRLSDPGYTGGVPAEFWEAFIGEIERDWGGPVGLAKRAPSMMSDRTFIDWWTTYLRMSASPGAVVALTRMNGQIDVRDVLPSIRVPTLILHRTGDLSVPVEASRYMAGHIPGAEYVELPGDDHLPFVGDQDAILNHVERFLTGATPITAPDRVLFTILAMEVAHATEAAARLGPAEWSAAVEAHGALVREELNRFRGRQIGTSGVGFVATFEGPTPAVRFAAAIVEAARPLRLAMRAGVHTGECDVVGDDVRGLAVQIACSVLAQARPNEILVTSPVKDLVAGSGLEFEDGGARVLDGVPDPWRTYRVEQARHGQWPAMPEAPLGGSIWTAQGPQSGHLTERERQVAVLLARGLSNRQIAEDLVITTATAERHVANVLNKLGFHSRVQIAAWAAQQELHRARFA